MYDGFSGEIGARSGPVFYDDGLAEPLLHRLRDQPRDNIPQSSWRKTDENTDGGPWEHYGCEGKNFAA